MEFCAHSFFCISSLKKGSNIESTYQKLKCNDNGHLAAMCEKDPLPDFETMLHGYPMFTCASDKLPSFKESAVVQLIQYVMDQFSAGPISLDISGEFVTVGDLHGHVFDLIRILTVRGMPPKTNYLFLGDYVDRGNFCLETIVLIYLLKALYPNQVYVVRGNHEMQALCNDFGFRDEIESIYQSPLVFNLFVKSFGFMPLAALVNGDVFCVHGGIGPMLGDIGMISMIQRPLVQFDQRIADEILWSDPSEEIDGFRRSERGRGYVYGKAVLNEFLEHNQLRLLVRGHQSIDEGVRFQMDGKVVTVFSASQYSDSPNPSGVLILKPDGEEPLCLPSLGDIDRDDVVFEPVDLKAKLRTTQPFGFLGDANDVKRVKPLAASGGTPARTTRKSLTINARSIGSIGPQRRVPLGRIPFG